MADDRVVADSARAMMLIEPGRHPAYYLPRADFDAGWLAATPLAWALEAGRLGLAPDADHFTVAWAAVRWFEEDEEIFRHPRNPYARCDAIPSSRRVQVVVDGEVVADSSRAAFLFETGLMTRHYLPVEDVRPGILRDSTLTTYCPYKGTARYHSVELNGRLHEDIVWTYPDPNGEVAKIRGLLAFYNEKVEAVLVDGRPAAPRFPMRI